MIESGIEVLRADVPDDRWRLVELQAELDLQRERRRTCHALISSLGVIRGGSLEVRVADLVEQAKKWRDEAERLRADPWRRDEITVPPLTKIEIPEEYIGRWPRVGLTFDTLFAFVFERFDGVFPRGVRAAEVEYAIHARHQSSQMCDLLWAYEIHGIVACSDALCVDITLAQNRFVAHQPSDSFEGRSQRRTVSLRYKE